MAHHIVRRGWWRWYMTRTSSVTIAIVQPQVPAGQLFLGSRRCVVNSDVSTYDEMAKDVD